MKFHQCRGALSGLIAALLAEQKFVATKEFLTAKDGGCAQRRGRACRSERRGGHNPEIGGRASPDQVRGPAKSVQRLKDKVAAILDRATWGRGRECVTR